MRLCVQRVSQASVTVAGEVVGQVQQGILVLLGVAQGDTEQDARKMAEKVESGSDVGIFLAQFGTRESAYWTYLRKDGKAIMKQKFAGARPFNCGRAWVNMELNPSAPFQKFFTKPKTATRSRPVKAARSAGTVTASWTVSIRP